MKNSFIAQNKHKKLQNNFIANFFIALAPDTFPAWSSGTF
jgi:hypothetical protein